MDEIQAELSSELTAEDFQQRFEQAREEQNWKDMTELFNEMEAYQFHDLARECKRELSNGELISLVAQTV